MRDVDAQLEDIRSYCETKGHDLDRIYKDVQTGRNVDRNEYYKLLDQIEDYEVLVTRGTFRFGRDKAGLSQAYLIQKARAADVIVETTTGGRFDFEDKYDRALFRMLGIVADLEVSSMHERIKTGKREGAKAGYWVCGPAPTGYETVGPQGSKLLVPTDQAPHVRYLFERYAEGASMRELADTASDLHDWEGACSQPGIRKLLTNPVYAGRIRWQGETYEGQHDPIVPPDLWEAVQDVREGRRETYTCWQEG